MPNITIADREAWRRLGQRQDVLPEIATEYSPTIQFADLSRMISSPGPARAIASASLLGVGGQRSTFEIQCNSPGGLVVERLTADGSNLAARYLLDRVVGTSALPTVAHLDLATPIDPLTVSTFHAGATVAAATGITLASSQDLELELNMFIPNGSLFRLASSLVFTVDRCTLFWREFVLLSRSP